MIDQNKKAIEDLREFMNEENGARNQFIEKEKSSEKSLNWRDIAIGVYVGGMALAATGFIIWLIIAGLFLSLM